MPCDFQRVDSRCRRDPNWLAELSEETQRRNPDVDCRNGKKWKNDERRGMAKMPVALTRRQTGVQLAMPSWKSSSEEKVGGVSHFPWSSESI